MQESPTVEAVEQCIRALLPNGYPSVARAAKALDTSVRTLQRLHAAGVTYRELVDRLRLEAALPLIEETDVPLQTIAESLGFSEPGSLSRLFARKRGVAPSVLRRNHRRATQ